MKNSKDFFYLLVPYDIKIKTILIMVGNDSEKVTTLETAQDHTGAF